MTRLLARIAAVLFAALAAGCGGEPKLVPASGVLTLGGKPLPNVSVQFMPDSLNGATGPASVGITDADGKFVLKTIDGRDGATPGSHIVTVTDVDEERPAQGRQPTRKPRFDARLSLPAAGLRAEVPATGGSVPVELNKSK